MRRPSSTTRRNLAIAKEVGDRVGEGGAYGNLGNGYDLQGDFSEGYHDYHAQYLAIAKEVGEPGGGGQGVREV